MNILTRLKIGPRLMLGFATVLALTLAVGLFSINRIGKVNEATAELATNWLVSMRSLGEYSAAMSTIRRAEALHVMATKEEEFVEQEKRIADNKAKAEASLRHHVDTVTLDEEKALVREIEDAQKTYYAELANLVQVSRSSGTNIAAPQALYRTKTRDAFNAIIAGVNKEIDFQSRGGDAAYKASQEAYESTRAAVIALIIASIAIGAAMAILITRSITAPIANAVRVAETVAAGDLTSNVKSDSTDETGQLLAALGKMNTSLQTIVSQVRNSSDSIATGSTQIATGNADLSQRTEEQASNLQQTAASMEQLTVTVKQNADTARTANQLAAGASDAATKGGEVVGQVVATMDEISHSSKRIADIISVIDGIAFQTNILALNAAVEAARAGEQGRGFAVVAGEVRNLAQRSATAAKEIKDLIHESVEKVGRGTAQVSEAGKSMDDIVHQVRKVSDLIAEITNSSHEQSTGIGQIGDAVNQLDQVTQQNAALVEESAAAAESLKHQAAQLAQAVSVFRVT